MGICEEWEITSLLPPWGLLLVSRVPWIEALRTRFAPGYLQALTLSHCVQGPRSHLDLLGQ